VRILLAIHHQLDPDQGAPGATLALGAELSKLGHEVSYLSFDDVPERMPALAKELLFPELAAVHLARRARQGLDVIDAASGDAWLWARFLRHRGERPLLVTRAHGLEHRFWLEQLAEARRAGKPLARRTLLYHGGWRLREGAASLRLADRCVFLNRDDLEYAVERLGVSRARSVVMANGVPAQFLGRPLASLRAEPLRIAYLGSWAERKGSHYAAAALGRVLAERNSARVSVLGARVDPERVLAEFPAGVHDRVEVVPAYAHDELPGLLDGHSVLISATLAEGFSLALLEAMACGLAPVVTDLSAARAVIRDGESGILVPPRDPDALASALLRLDGDRELLERLRRTAHATAQHYSWQRVAGETVELYERALRDLQPSGV
jgi:glycosyltransferase involved in cell wall biosynthesis